MIDLSLRTHPDRQLWTELDGETDMFSSEHCHKLSDLMQGRSLENMGVRCLFVITADRQIPPHVKGNDPIATPVWWSGVISHLGYCCPVCLIHLSLISIKSYCLNYSVWHCTWNWNMPERQKCALDQRLISVLLIISLQNSTPCFYILPRAFCKTEGLGLQWRY